MAWLLNTVYLLLIVACSPALMWQAWRHGKYRQGWRQKLLGDLPQLDARPRLWFHAVSVGEVQLLQPIVTALRAERADLDLVITTTTQTGYELARRRYPDLTVAYCPLDFSWAVHRAFDRLQPTMLVLAELELWPNLIRTAAARHVPITIVNGRLGQRSAKGYGRIRPFIRQVLSRLTWIGAQDHTIAARFIALGAPASRVTVTGSVKFDGAESDRQNARTRDLSSWAGFEPHDQVWLVGSTQDPEERLALAVFDQLAPRFSRLKLVLVPRHAERFEDVATLVAQSQWTWRRRSDTGAAPGKPPRIVVVDTIGELGAWWGTASIGFVGGSLTQRGGQNMIEPSAYGVATCFGPHTHNFRDIVGLLLQADACQVVHDQQELHDFVERCLVDPDYRQSLGQRAAQVVAQHRGGTRRTVDRLLELLGPPPLPSRAWPAKVAPPAPMRRTA